MLGWNMRTMRHFGGKTSLAGKATASTDDGWGSAATVAAPFAGPPRPRMPWALSPTSGTLVKTKKSTLLPVLADGIPDTDQPTAADGNLLVGGIGEVFQGY